MDRAEIKRLNELGEPVGPVSQRRSLLWIRRLPCAWRVPRDHTVRIGQTVELADELPAVERPSVEQDNRRAGSSLAIRDRVLSDLCDGHIGPYGFTALRSTL